MAAACLDSEETEDLVTCSICCCEYDDDLRKPKFLDCFHTFCIQCMQELRVTTLYFIPCPLCRVPTTKGIEQMKTNVYAVHMSKLRQDAGMQTRGMKWCFTCSSLLNAQCPAKHYSIAIPSKNICDGQELQQKLDLCQAGLFISIQKRLVVQKELRNLLHSLKKVEGNIREQMEQNDEQLVLQMSTLDDLQRTGASTETFGLLQSKIDQIEKDTINELEQLKKRLDELEKEKTTRLKIQFENAQKTKLPSCQLFENGFCQADNAEQVDEELHVLTHLACSINRNRKMGETPVSTQLEVPQPVRSELNPYPDGMFILMVKNGDKVLGQILMKPSIEFRAVVSMQGPQTSQSKVLKAIPYKYVALQFPIDKLHLTGTWSKRQASNPKEVGLCSNGLIFVLSRKSPVDNCWLIGNIEETSNLNMLIALSQTSKDQRVPLSITWEIFT